MQNIQKYQFTLVLKNVDENTANLEDSLFEAGCDDALINFKNGTVYLDFERDGDSFAETILKAIKDVESASIDAVVTNVAPENLVTESEVAKRLNIKRQAVSLWIKGQRRKSSPFPKPFMNLSKKSPLWKWHEIVKWLYQNRIINQEEMVKSAEFIENVNAVLEGRDIRVKKIRQELLHKLEGYSH